MLHMDNGCDLEKLIYKDISHFTHDEARKVLAQIDRIERKTFPSSEAFSFSSDLLKTPNASIGLLVTSDVREYTVVASCLIVRTKGIALLHKICVIETWRAKGVGKMLMARTMEVLAHRGTRYIQQWVMRVGRALGGCIKVAGLRK
jgi:GNAT superfamily N-acetyltransferase